MEQNKPQLDLKSSPTRSAFSKDSERKDERLYQNNETKLSFPGFSKQTTVESYIQTTETDSPNHSIQAQLDQINFQDYKTERYRGKRDSSPVQQLIKATLERARRCRESLNRSYERSPVERSNRNYYLPNFSQNHNEKPLNYSNQYNLSYNSGQRYYTEEDSPSRINFKELFNKYTSNSNKPSYSSTAQGNYKYSRQSSLNRKDQVPAWPVQERNGPLPYKSTNLNNSYRSSSYGRVNTEPEFRYPNEEDSPVNLSRMFAKKLASSSKEYSRPVREVCGHERYAENDNSAHLDRIKRNANAYMTPERERPSYLNNVVPVFGNKTVENKDNSIDNIKFYLPELSQEEPLRMKEDQVLISFKQKHAELEQKVQQALERSRIAKEVALKIKGDLPNV